MTNIPKNYHLIKKVALTNMHLYSTNGSIKKYNSVKSILMEYYTKRLELYEKRREYMLNKLKEVLDLLSYKVKFILLIVNKKLVINNKKKSEIEDYLKKNKFPKYNKTYNYLLGMQLYTLTYEKIRELKKQMKNKKAEYKQLKELSASDIWRNELMQLKLNL